MRSGIWLFVNHIILYAKRMRRKKVGYTDTPKEIKANLYY